jgi:hypothetical protein
MRKAIITTPSIIYYVLCFIAGSKALDHKEYHTIGGCPILLAALLHGGRCG